MKDNSPGQREERRSTAGTDKVVSPPHPIIRRSTRRLLHFLLSVLLGIGINIPLAGISQGIFQNLDFEAAVVPDLPANQTAFIPFTNAFPGWNAITNPAASALYNGISIGAALVSIIDGHTAFYSNRVIEGYFTAVIQSGNVNPPQTYGPASLFQTGLIPASAHSLLFAASGGSTTNFFVTLNGQTVPYFPVGSGPNFVTYGADISSFAGQTTELRFTSQPGANAPFTTIFLDDIRFSDLAIPEPSGLSLAGLGALLLGRQFVRTRRP